jgi:hypothetical protein
MKRHLPAFRAESQRELHRNRLMIRNYLRISLGVGPPLACAPFFAIASFAAAKSGDAKSRPGPERSIQEG